MSEHLRVFNNGGGVQSTAALVLAAKAKFIKGLLEHHLYDWAADEWLALSSFFPHITRDQFLVIADYPIFIHANVGDDSESPATIAYMKAVHVPFAEAHGIRLVEVRHTKRDGSQPTLLQRAYSSPQSVPLPMRGVNGSPMSRTCTGDFKIKPLTKWLKEHGATKDNPAISGLGITLDEFQRMKTDSGIAWQRLEYPLIDLRLSREDCRRIIEGAGLPPAPKSACWFCPFNRRQYWQKLHDHQPAQFQHALEIEAYLSKKSTDRGKPPLFLTGYAIPLDQVVAGHQSEMDFDDNCEGGYCHT